MVNFMKNRVTWTGRVSDLWNEFSILAPNLGFNSKMKAFPSQPNTLSRRLNSLQSNLKSVGIVFKSKPCSDATYLTIKNKNISSLPPYQISVSETLKSHNGDNIEILSDHDADDDDSVDF